MSGMSNMLCITLYREAFTRNEPKRKRGTAARDVSIPKAVPLSISSLREESWAAWMDAQHAAHAAHAVDPWVLDGCPLAPRRATQQLTDFRHEPLSRERTRKQPDVRPERLCTAGYVVDNEDGTEM